MKQPSDDDWDVKRSKIMGLGETSLKKSYYPELQQKLAELQRFKTLLDQTTDIIFLLEVPDGRLADVNQSASRKLGYSREELLGMKMDDLSSPLTASWMNEFLSCPDSCRGSEEMIITILHGKDGVELPVEMTLRLVPFRDSVYAVAVARDITKRKQVQEEVRKSEQRYRTLVESSSDAILLVDPDRMIVSCNRAFLALFGYSLDDVSRKSTRILHPSEDSYRSLFEKAVPFFQDTGSFRTEWELMRKDGSVFPIEETVSAIRGPDESIQGYVAIIRDITERKQAEEELRLHRDHLEELVQRRTADLEAAHKALMQEEKLRTLGAISAEVAHEIRNPLVSVGGFARRLHRKYPESVEAEIILKECGRLEKILERIKNYLEPVEMRPRECSVNSIINQCVDLVYPELDGENVSLELELDPDLPAAYADPGILMEVILNMISKSSKAMDKSRPLRIRTYASGRNIQIDFTSTVSRRVIQDPELLLLPFEDQGSVMGVPICIKLLKEMGGLLLFKQERERVVFNVLVPKADPSMNQSHLTTDQEYGDREIRFGRH